MVTHTPPTPDEVRDRALDAAAAGNYETARLLRAVADEMEAATTRAPFEPCSATSGIRPPVRSALRPGWPSRSA